MFDFGKLGAFMDILPKIEGAVPEVLERLTHLETTMLALAKRNIELLEMIEKNTRPVSQINGTRSYIYNEMHRTFDEVSHD